MKVWFLKVDSATEQKHINKQNKKGAIRLNKKEMIDTAVKTVLHDIPHEHVKQPISQEDYNQLL
jgi:hypothetical protein